MNAWSLVPHRHVWTHNEEATLKRNAYDNIYIPNNLLADWWQLMTIDDRGRSWRSCCPTDAKTWESWITLLSSKQCLPDWSMMSFHVMGYFNSANCVSLGLGSLELWFHQVQNSYQLSLISEAFFQDIKKVGYECVLWNFLYFTPTLLLRKEGPITN